MKHHLLGIKENGIACTFVPHNIKDMFIKLLQDKEKKIKEANRQDCFEEIDIQDSNKKGTLESFLRKGKQGVIKQKIINEVFKDI